MAMVQSGGDRQAVHEESVTAFAAEEVKSRVTQRFNQRIEAVHFCTHP